MPDQTNAAYDPADQGGQQALVEQLLANPAFLETVRGLIDDSIASAAEDVPNCHMAACPPANQGFPGIRQYAVQPFASNPGDAATCHAPLIMPPDNSLHATFTGMTSPMPYMTTDGQIYMFPGTVNGVDVYGFCVDHALPAPIGSFGNISIDVALNGQTQATKLAVAFVIANVPRLPTDDAVEFFQMLGLPCATGFNGYDARSVGRYVIYALLGQLSGGLAGLQFIDRPGYPPIDPAKADCLKEACQILFEMALAYGAGTLDCGPGGGPGGGGNAGAGSGGANACCNSVCGSNYTCGGCGCSADKCTCNDPCGLRMGCQIGKIYCCNTNQAVTDMSDTYLVFVGCANDLRECCGRVVVGPFKLASSNRGTPDISLVPCNGCPGADIQLTDFCCNILAEPPAIGDEFYVAFRPPSCRYCFDLCATMETTSVAVYFFREAGNAAVQRQGLSFPRTDTRTTCIHICIDITPEPPPPGPEPWWEHILVNNNNNNNNNDSSNNDNNDNNSNLISNLVESLLTNLLSSSNMMGGMLGRGFGPGPPFPPGIGPWPPGAGPFPPGPGPFPPGPGPCDGFPFPWKLFPPGTTPCPPLGCGGPNPCCCCNKSPCCCPPPCPNNCCCPCPPPYPPPCWCPPPYPACPPPCPPWPCPCPEPCFLPYPYIPEPGFIIQPAIPTYQAVPMPVPCFCPPPVPAFQQPSMPPFQPFPQPYPPMPMPYPPFYPYAEDGGDAQPVQQVYNPVTVVVPPPDPPQPPVVIMPEADPWVQYGAPPMAFPQHMGMPFPSSAGPVFPPPQPPPQPFYPPVIEPMPLLLPEISSAPRPDLSAFNFADDGPSDLYDQFYRDWYVQ